MKLTAEQMVALYNLENDELISLIATFETKFSQMIFLVFPFDSSIMTLFLFLRHLLSGILAFVGPVPGPFRSVPYFQQSLL